MKFTFLGTSSGLPTKARNVTGLALAAMNSKRWYLVDCGEATQHQILHTPYSVKRLEAVFITHVHGDHCFGLPGLLASCSMHGRTQKLTIYAPKGVREFVEAAIVNTDSHLGFDLEFVLVGGPGLVHEDEFFAVQAIALSHRVECYAYQFFETGVQVHLDTGKLDKMGVPPGPMYGSLKRGETVTLEDGRVLDGNDFILPAPDPRSVVVGGDNDNPGCIDEAKGRVNVLIHESTYMEEDMQNITFNPQHSSARRVAQYAQEAGIDNLVLTHFSARYGSTKDGGTMDKLIAEARDCYGGRLFVAEDLQTFELDREGNLHLNQ